MAASEQGAPMSMARWNTVVEDAIEDPGGRLLAVSVVEHSPGVAIATVAFRAADLRGDEYRAEARLYIPIDVLEERVASPTVWMMCGYEIPEASALERVRADRIVVVPSDPSDDEVFPHSNPLARGPSADFVLAHLVRGMRFVDPARVVYAGGSAGGYASLLVAAEAFPSGATVATVPVVNLAYQGAYFMANCARLAADPPPESPLVGMLMAAFAQFVDVGWGRGYGSDVSDPAWSDHSPMSHLDRITGPVAAFFSTADFLVPIAQVGEAVSRSTLDHLPSGLTMAVSELTAAPAASARLLDVLGDAADVRVVGVPDGAVAMSTTEIDFTMSTPQTSVPIPAASADGPRWLVTVVDEGPTVFGIGHTRHAITPDFEPFAAGALDRGISVDQLTAAKLDQLVDRWSGREWLAPGFSHLDSPEAEKADVEAGLAAYRSTSPAHEANFRQLYERLPDERRVLPATDGLTSESHRPSS